MIESNIIETSPALEMKGITKNYPGVKALDNVNFSVLPGEVHALLGENGAGKSTLMKVLAGAQRMDSGEIFLNGKKVTINSPQKAMSLGIGIIYQEFNLVPYLSAAENIFLGREPHFAVPVFINYQQMYKSAQQIIDNLGVSLDVKTPVSSLSIAQQQIVEIAKAISQNSSIIVMDEPSAALTDRETEKMFDLIRSLKEKGVSIIYISHRLEEIFEIADRVTVLRDGQYIGTESISNLDQDTMIRMMVGRELKEQIPGRSVETGDPVLQVKNLSRGSAVRNVSFEVRKGEVLGIAGLVGAGRTELARLIFGADRADNGEMLLNGKPLDIRSPSDAIRNGIGFVTEDRKSLGLVLDMPIRSNTTLANLSAVAQAGFISGKREVSVSGSFVKDLDIRTPGVEQLVRNLSGGNQQKVVLAKWLFTQSNLLIFDEPTRGIDVAAKAEIYSLINSLVEKGAAVIVISSDLLEVIGISDRILVMRDGVIAGEVSGSEATQENIMSLAIGAGTSIPAQ